MTEFTQDPKPSPAQETEPNIEPAWRPPENGGTTEETEYEIGKLDPEEEALNNQNKS